MLLLLNVFVFGFVVVSARVEFYRKDYTYVQEYDAFYKLHSDGNFSSWNTAFLTCDDEVLTASAERFAVFGKDYQIPQYFLYRRGPQTQGSRSEIVSGVLQSRRVGIPKRVLLGAKLFYPETKEEWKVAMKFQKLMPSASTGTNEIFVGIHDKFTLGEYVNINGQPINISLKNKDETSEHCVTMDIGTGAYKLGKCYMHSGFRPFICKKVEDVTCPTIDKGYKYVKETKKCYKINTNPKTWSKAMETCFMEGGLLVVIESYKLEDGGYKLEDGGYNTWRNNDELKYDCGNIMDNGNNIYLGAHSCDTEIKPFVCEMSVEK
ncbi:unnamed protein product [Diatraea saccharalis]|uniref:C-type lectin domain-containing protein n=1 Tax=Diatraea saccharalis TaxID=40085 RepID=A0A9N9WDA6_9NEOP|nr:unnamed protein product [Diatraea saccharalis]